MATERKLDGNYWDRLPGGRVPLPGNGGGVRIADRNIVGVPGSVPGTASGPAKDEPIQPTPQVKLAPPWNLTGRD